MDFKKLELENKSLKETCEVLSDKKILSDISQSLKEISKGEIFHISDL